MSHRIYGEKIIFGIQEPKPIDGLPAGKQRLKMRNTEFARVHVRTSGGIRSFYLRDAGDRWEASHEIGSNRTLPKRDRGPAVAVAEYADGTREEVYGA